jgi:hypothetical protein
VEETHFLLPGGFLGFGATGSIADNNALVEQICPENKLAAAQFRLRLSSVARAAVLFEPQ